MIRRKNILIQTIPRDLHSAIVAHHLVERGHTVVMMFSNAFPKNDSISIFYEDKQVLEKCNFRSTELIGSPDVVWRRRLGAIEVPDGVGHDDRQFVVNESQDVIKAIIHIHNGSFFVNDPVASMLTDLKPYQLKKALQAGFNIPATLISNDPHEVRSFLKKNSKSCIFKPIKGWVWDTENGRRSTYTAEISLDQLPSDEIVASCPGIFQKKVEKKYEVRAQFFGKYWAAIKIDSNNLVAGDLDWRIDQKSIKRCESVQIPAEIQAACFSLMSSLGIAAGAFDFIVTPDDEWFFLEVNEAGQFLFMEEWCEELQLLNAFCCFLEHGNVDFRGPKFKSNVKFEIERKKMTTDEIWRSNFM